MLKGHCLNGVIVTVNSFLLLVPSRFCLKELQIFSMRAFSVSQKNTPPYNSECFPMDERNEAGIYFWVEGSFW